MAEENSKDTIITDAIERFKDSQDGSFYNREAAEDDIEFGRLAIQWPEKIRVQRKLEGRPCLTINKLPAFVRQIVNEARQNKPGLKVSPVDNGADVDTADVIGGLVRSIERKSNSDIAYDTALDHAVSGGFGFFRIVVDYVHDDSFEMEARIERIPNPLMVHWDTSSTMFDASDWEYGFISDFMEEEEFERKYPKASKIDFETDRRVFHEQYIDGNMVQIAEYWLREDVERTLFLLSDGNTMRKEDFIKTSKSVLTEGNINFKGMSDDELIGFYLQTAGLSIAKERQVLTKKVIRRVISGVEVLEEEDWVGSTIPICPVWGEEVMINGRRYFRSMIRDARDSQAMFNFWRSATTELVALAPRAPFIMEENALPKKGPERAKWSTANNRSHAYLQYAQGADMPQRQPFAGVPAGALQEALNASDDMKAIIGIYDPSLGARSNETSGRAILARQKESDISNVHFPDNLSRAIQYAGRVLVEIIPHVYSDREVLRILGEDQKEKIVKLGQGERADPEGEKLYNLSVGLYDVNVESGASYTSQREESRETLIEIMRAWGESAPILADKLMELMDFQGAQDLAKRLRLMLPPQIQQAEMQEDMKDMPPEIREIMGQAQQQIQQLQQQLEQATSERQPEMAKLQIEQTKAQGDAQTDQAKLQIEKGKAEAEIEIKQDANEINAEKVEIEKKKVELEERKVVLLELAALKEPEENGNGHKESDNGDQAKEGQDRQAIMAGLLAVAKIGEKLVEAEKAPVEIIRDENDKIVGGAKVIEEKES